MVAVPTATETVAAGAAMLVAGAPTTAAGTPTSAPGIGADGIAFAITAGTATTAACAATSAASAARSAWHFGRRVAHIAQYFPPFLEEVHAPRSQLEAKEEETMIRGLWVLVVMVVWGVVHAGFVCAARPCCFVRHKCTKKSANHSIFAGSHRVLATAVDNWSGKPFCVSS
jgi:hypothetical protein